MKTTLSHLFFPGRIDSRRGFTLVEMLLVMAIISVLFAMLLPAIDRARQKAKAMNCAANLRTIGVALAQYGYDNGGSLPILGEGGDGISKKVIKYGMSDWYRIAIGYLLPPDKLPGAMCTAAYPYYDNERNLYELGVRLPNLFNCPTVNRFTSKNYFGPTQGGTWGLWIGGKTQNVMNYSFNNVGSTAGTGIDASKIKRLEQVPNNQIVIMDRDYICNWTTTQTNTNGAAGTGKDNCIPAGMGSFYWSSWFSAAFPATGNGTAGTPHESSMPGTGARMGGANILFSGLNVGICVASRQYYPGWRGRGFDATFSGVFNDKITY